MKCKMIFFDEKFVLKITKEKGTPIWDIKANFLKWMIERCDMAANIEPLERDIIQAFISERHRLQQLYLKKQEEQESHEVVEKRQEEAFFQQAGLSGEGADSSLPEPPDLPPPPWEEAVEWKEDPIAWMPGDAS